MSYAKISAFNNEKSETCLVSCY